VEVFRALPQPLFRSYFQPHGSVSKDLEVAKWEFDSIGRKVSVWRLSVHLSNLDEECPAPSIGYTLVSQKARSWSVGFLTYISIVSVSTAKFVMRYAFRGVLKLMGLTNRRAGYYLLVQAITSY
jgi:hypothetical protein